MQENYRVARTYFLLTNCGDPNHKQHCGAANDEQCCELGARVYKWLRNEKGMDNNDLAKAIALDLQKEYGHFQWSAVVFPGQSQHDADCLVNDKHRPTTWLHRSGSESDSTIRKAVREKVVVSDGLGDYGCFVGYRIRNFSRKVAVVFWADPDALYASKGTMQAYDRLQEKAKLTRELSTGSVHSLTTWVRQQQEDYVFAVGVKVRGDNEPSVGMYLAGKDNRQFPLCLRGDSRGSFVLLWPTTSVASDQELECKVDPGTVICLVYICIGFTGSSELTKRWDVARRGCLGQGGVICHIGQDCYDI